MQIRKVPKSCHSDKRWIWLLEALGITNPSKKLTVPAISAFNFWQLEYSDPAFQCIRSDYDVKINYGDNESSCRAKVCRTQDCVEWARCFFFFILIPLLCGVDVRMGYNNQKNTKTNIIKIASTFRQIRWNK